jgi:hypothetical protein
MMLIAIRPVLYHAHQYSIGDSLPVNDPEMTELWIQAGTAVWQEADQTASAKAAPVTATPGMPGISDSGTEDLAGRITETPDRQTDKPKPRRKK